MNKLMSLEEVERFIKQNTNRFGTESAVMIAAQLLNTIRENEELRARPFKLICEKCGVLTDVHYQHKDSETVIIHDAKDSQCPSVFSSKDSDHFLDLTKMAKLKQKCTDIVSKNIIGWLEDSPKEESEDKECYCGAKSLETCGIM